MNTERSSGKVLAALSFPKSRLALWDPSPVEGPAGGLHLCFYRNPRLLVLEKALRLAQRHARQSGQPKFCCFLLGSVSVDEDEEGVTITLERFDPGREQSGTPAKAPPTLVPGDVLVPCVLVSQEAVEPVFPAAEINPSFQMLYQACSGREPVNLAKLLRVSGHVSCVQRGDRLAFCVRWLALTCANSLDVEAVSSIPIIPTALSRSLSADMSLRSAKRQQGFLTMDQTRKLLLLLESDPKSSSLPLVGVWLSGIIHVTNPLVWASCLRFLFSSTLQSRVLSESGSFLVVLFPLSHVKTQFFQCRPVSRSAGRPELQYQLLTSTHTTTLYQNVEAVGYLQCELSVDDTQEEELGKGLSDHSSVLSHLPIIDHDSGVEDLSPRPSPNPHPPTQQNRRVQPSVPELSLLMDSSFVQSAREPSLLSFPAGPAGQRTQASTSQPSQRRKSVHSVKPSPKPGCPAESSSLSGDQCHPPLLPNPHPTSTPISHPTHNPNPGQKHFHSTPQSNLSQSRGFCCPGHSHNLTPIPLFPGLLPPPPCSTQADSDSMPAPPAGHPCSSHQMHTCPPPAETPPSPQQTAELPHPSGGCSCQKQRFQPYWGAGLPSDAYQILLDQDRQLRLLQSQIQMLLEGQVKPLPVNHQAPNQPPIQDLIQPPKPVGAPLSTTSVAVETGASLFWGVPGNESFSKSSDLPSSPPAHTRVGDGARCRQSPVLGESASMVFHPDSQATPHDQHNFYPNLLRQVNSRLQEEESNKNLNPSPDGSQPSTCSSSSSRQEPPRRKSLCDSGDAVISATLCQPQQLGVSMHSELAQPKPPEDSTVENTRILASINPAAVVSRLSLSESNCNLLPENSADLSLEANAIALRYLTDRQICRQTSKHTNILSSANMSVATRGYMRKYGLLEEDDEEDPVGLPLSDTFSFKHSRGTGLPQIHQPLAPSSRDKENCPVQLASLAPPQGSVGNFLDLSRLRQLPKLF